MKKRKKKYNYYSFLFRVCREKWSTRSPLKKECLKNSSVKVGKLDKYRCADCKDLFAASEVQCDHIEPIIILPTTLEEFHTAIDRLESSNLQILCKQCHVIKTKIEKNTRERLKMVGKVSEYDFISDHFIINSDYKMIKRIYDLVIKFDAQTDLKKKKSIEKKVLKITSLI